jgi:Tol biopolymer transport system component
MPVDAAARERIDSWKEIAAYLRRDIRTVIRWEKERGLPVHRIPGGQRNAVFAYREELNNWLAGPDHSNGSAPVSVADSQPPAANPEPAGPDEAEDSLARPLPGGSSRRKLVLYSAVGSLAALLLAGAAYLLANRWLSPRALQLVGQRQLTANGQEKEGLLADGTTLYFGQEQDGRFALASMPADGGPIRVLWNPPANVFPVDISPDGKNILALIAIGVEKERQLWIVPVEKGEPRRLGSLMAHNAAWAPDGKTVACAAGNSIYLIDEDGSGAREIGSFAAVADALVWSRDGRRLSFVLQDISTAKLLSWGQISGDGMKTITLQTRPRSLIANDTSPCAAGWDACFERGPRTHLGSTTVTLVQYGQRWWERDLQVEPLGTVAGGVLAIASPKESAHVFVLDEPRARTAFTEFDPQSQTFRGILPGASGTFLDYSRDGKWVAYSQQEDGSLWVGRADGSDARQMTTGPDKVELPRWSPDGKRIAYMVQHGDRPWRINILELDSGATREASAGNDSQGAPTWSPDGRFLVYGNVECEQVQTCAIHRLDLATGQVHTLPDSEGLSTARWSPDGRFIAAMNAQEHRLMLFDVKTGQWHKLADMNNGPDLSWSADSKYLYANILGAAARIVRIKVSDGQQQTALDLNSQDKLDMAETKDIQFSLAPDDSVILHRRIHSEEIYAYAIREQ